MEVREEVRQLAEPLAEELGYEVVDVEHAVQGRHRVIRVLLDKPTGISIADCAAFSRRLEDCLDMNQTVTGSYRLEVSSPGIDRPLRTLEAASRFSGRRAALATHEARDGRRNYEGRLLGPDGRGRAGIRTDDGEEFWFEWSEIRSARLIGDPWERSDGSPDRSGEPQAPADHTRRGGTLKRRGGQA